MQGMSQHQGLVILQLQQELLQRRIVEVALSPASDNILTQVAETEFASRAPVAEIVPDQTLIPEAITDFGITRQIRAHSRQVPGRAEISLGQIGSAGRGERQRMIGADIPDIRRWGRPMRRARLPVFWPPLTVALGPLCGAH